MDKSKIALAIEIFGASLIVVGVWQSLPQLGLIVLGAFIVLAIEANA